IALGGIGVIAAALLSGVHDAAAAPNWSIQPTRNAVVPGGSLAAISCSAASACTAVGSYRNLHGTPVTLAEHWDGSAWTLQATPNPAGATEAALASVSCPSSTACIAVGHATVGGALTALAVRWNGSAWSLLIVPSPGGKNAELLSVSCHSATQCTAVGDYYTSADASLTLAERWDGSTWTVQTTPNPSGSLASALEGVSCPTSGACYAVGYRVDTGSSALYLAIYAITETWTGGRWMLQPAPAFSKFNGLSAVSCL